MAGFPMEPAQLPFVRGLVKMVSEILSEVTGLTPDLFLQVAQLHLAGGSSIFAAEASEWNPTMGLGIFPDRDPPRTWTREDFEKLEPGQKVRPTSHKIFALGVTGEARHRAWQKMFGRGVTLEIYSPPPGSGFLKRTVEEFLPRIEEKIFRRYPFFIPLFDARSLEHASAENLASWSCGFSAYVRESAEDKSILVVSQIPLEEALRKAGISIAEKN
ncbi:MAG TPA: hypothetical protein VMB85_13250 [Bryobacteraceae bacterium]|nr:hypothetical protein [Bryobacteraceae bacterium]